MKIIKKSIEKYRLELLLTALYGTIIWIVIQILFI
jgi:hypothetical protein